MVLNKIYKYVAYAMLLAGIALVGCADPEEDLNAEQIEDIESYLTSSHSPTLIDEQDIDTFINPTPEFYSTFGNKAFRYILDYYNADRELQSLISAGDRISLTLSIYEFEAYTSSTTTQGLLYSNDPDYKDIVIEYGLNASYWTFEPKEIVVGSGDIIKGVDAALVGCRLGDSVEFYVSCDEGYGDKEIGVTGVETALVFICKIEI
ncbi:MAG: FKBP-type peptidyl-prolyl cis-trans isomerase [Rikenellaceae bacterium]